jgi:hypothetical protein
MNKLKSLHAPGSRPSFHSLTRYKNNWEVFQNSEKWQRKKLPLHFLFQYIMTWIVQYRVAFYTGNIPSHQIQASEYATSKHNLTQYSTLSVGHDCLERGSAVQSGCMPGLCVMLVSPAMEGSSRTNAG